LLAHHHAPENRHLRWWLTHEVVAVLRVLIVRLNAMLKTGTPWQEQVVHS